MNIKNINLLSLLTLFFVIGCSQSDMTEGSNEGPVYQGPFYNEFWLVVQDQIIVMKMPERC